MNAVNQVAETFPGLFQLAAVRSEFACLLQASALLRKSNTYALDFRCRPFTLHFPVQRESPGRAGLPVRRTAANPGSA